MQIKVPALTWAVAAVIVVITPAVVSAQALPCAPGDAPFMSAASEIQYGCGYLLESTPSQYALAESYFRRALELEPQNAIARVLIGLSHAGQGEADEARAAFAEAARIDPAIMAKLSGVFDRRPALRGVAESVLATNATPAAPVANGQRGAGATPPRTAPAPAAPGPQETPVFPVGSQVEIEYRQGEWFQGVVTSVDPGVCPYYRVEADAYGNGSTSNLGYFCKSVRAPTGVGPTVAQCGGSNPNCPPTSPPPPGRYTCDVTTWDVAAGRARLNYQGYFELMPGGRYRWLDNGGSGSYSYNASTRVVTWSSGPMQSQGGASEYGLDGTTPEITITMNTDYTRRTGNEPVRWQCGLQR